MFIKLFILVWLIGLIINIIAFYICERKRLKGKTLEYFWKEFIKDQKEESNYIAFIPVFNILMWVIVLICFIYFSICEIIRWCWLHIKKNNSIRKIINIVKNIKINL